ncbi:MAG TPA: tetratricopeptide repeat protein [Ohtaekwangia sp.]|uniref:tetratricopeptide repeat protein n=1 Tax=Ohtaekwangia sp. TaxID=2066019 RepID=UPI002F938891
MIRYLLLVMSMVLATAAIAQKIPLINSGEVIEQAKVLYDSGKYEESIRTFLTIPKRDTNYVYMLTELALSYNANQQYDKTIEVCEEALLKPSIHRSHLLRSRAVAYDKKGDFDKSVGLFQKAIAQYPFDASLIYNLGITYYNHKDYEKAIDCFFKVLSINPFHGGSHLNLGRVAVGQGHKTHAMLSFGVYLAVNNEDNDRLVYIDKVVSNQIQDEGSISPIGSNGCEKLDQILRAKIALDKNFKSKVDVDAPVVKQYEMLFEQLGIINTSSDDRWVKYYLTFYKAIKERNLTEPFMYHILASASNDAVKKWRKKNEKTLNSFYVAANDELKRMRATLDAPEAGFTKPVMAWYDDNHRLNALGASEGDKRTGRWVYFHNNGERSAEGDYKAGVKVGIWKYYLNTGATKSIENSESGEVTVYFPDGAKRQHFYLKDDAIEGEVELYHACGGVREKLIYKAGKRDGKGKSFFPNGKVDMSYAYSDDKAQGEFVSYFENGQVYSVSNYKNDLREGSYTEYYANGKLRSKGAHTNDHSTGTWTYYYPNGRIEKTGAFKDGTSTGEWLFYDTRGNIIEKRNFNTEGLYHGEDTFFADGKPTSVHTYKNDVLTRIVYLDKNGKELGKYELGNGTVNAKTFYASGQMNGEGVYKKGKVEGRWTYYQPEGVKLSEYTYVAGLAQGEATEFFRHGQKKYIFQYKDNQLHGYYQEFHANGKVKEEGWMQDGQRQQQWLSYYPDGTIESDGFYLNDELIGDYYDYNSDGKLGATTTYEQERIADIKNYNSKGDMLTKKRPEENKQLYETFYPNQKIQSRLIVQCGNYAGTLTKWFPDGNVFYSYDMMSGHRHGAYKYYDISNQVHMEGQYINGSMEGIWKGHYTDGSLDYEGNYIRGNHDSTWTFYFRHGKISSVIPFQKDDRDGIARYNSPEGTPIVEKLYQQDDLIAYRVVNEKGEFGAWVPFTASTTIVAKYPNGTVAYEEPFKNGALEGVKRIYFSNGKLYSEFNYKHGDYEGPFKIYFPGGQLREKGQYRDDELHGVIEEYNEDGTLLKQETYTWGTRNGKSVINPKGGKSKEVLFWWGLPQ